jgi:hypothetical protein
MGLKNLMYTVPAIASKAITKSAAAGPFLNDYGWDFVFPWMVYHSFKAMAHFGIKSEIDFRTADKILLGSVSMLIPSFGEVAQYFHAYPGVYNPRDFIAYGLGTAATLAFDFLKDKKSLERKASLNA